MPVKTPVKLSEAECSIRSKRLDNKSANMWIPGRQRKLLADSFDLGQICRQHGYFDLAEQNFRRIQRMYANLQPSKTAEGLATFGKVAASYNLVGVMFMDQHRWQEAGPLFDQAIDIRQSLCILFPEDRENRIYLGGALCNRGYTSARVEPQLARDFFTRSLSALRQPNRSCECSYWDEQRQTWWCEQLEAMGLGWVLQAPHFIDAAMAGLESLDSKNASDDT